VWGSCQTKPFNCAADAYTRCPHSTIPVAPMLTCVYTHVDAPCARLVQRDQPRHLPRHLGGRCASSWRPPQPGQQGIYQSLRLCRGETKQSTVQKSALEGICERTATRVPARFFPRLDVETRHCKATARQGPLCDCRHQCLQGAACCSRYHHLHIIPPKRRHAAPNLMRVAHSPATL
jgi:hypothetical protein